MADKETVSWHNDGPSSSRPLDVQVFLDEFKMKANRKLQRSLLEMNFTSFEAFKLGIRVSHCCKDMKLDEAYAHYSEAKKLQVKPNNATFSNLLSLTAGLGEQGSGCGPIRTEEPPHNIDYAFEVYEDMKAAAFPMNEAIYSALIRCCSIHDRREKALILFDEMQAQNIPTKLRTFTPLLNVFAKSEDFETAFRLFNEMNEKYNVQPTEREFIIMLRLTVTRRDNRFYSLLKELSEEVPQPQDPEVWALLREWFESTPNYLIFTSAVKTSGEVECNGERLLSIDVEETQRLELMAQLDVFAVQRDDNRKYKPNNKVKDLIASSVFASASASAAATATTTDAATGGTASAATDTATATADGATIGSVSGESCSADATISSGESESIGEPGSAAVATTSALGATSATSGATFDATSADTATKLVTTEVSDRFAAYKKFQASDEGAAQRSAKWTQYKTWLSSKKFDVIVDGANVGYYKQNYQGAPTHVNYQQIDQMLTYLRAQGKTPLLVLHCRHLTHGMIPNEQVAEMTKRWETEGLMYRTPKGFNDDWFWIYTAVAYKCQIVTNDLMRDHHFQMLSPRWFNRWKERNQVHFEFGQWLRVPEIPVTPAVEETIVSGSNDTVVSMTADTTTADVVVPHVQQTQSQPVKSKYIREVSLFWPRLYSYCIQHIVSDKFEGFYCPPPPPEEEEEYDQEEGEESEEKEHQQQLEGQEEHQNTPQDEGHWLCAYVPISATSGTKREVSDGTEDSMEGELQEQDNKRQKRG